MWLREATVCYFVILPYYQSGPAAAVQCPSDIPTCCVYRQHIHLIICTLRTSNNTPQISGLIYVVYGLPLQIATTTQKTILVFHSLFSFSFWFPLSSLWFEKTWGENLGVK